MDSATRFVVAFGPGFQGLVLRGALAVVSSRSMLCVVARLGLQAFADEKHVEYVVLLLQLPFYSVVHSTLPNSLVALALRTLEFAERLGSA